jgi:photosystem II stability/assembly factor-like uncharacterized protein
LYRTTDGGASWAFHNLNPGARIRDLLIEPNGVRLYAAAESGGLWRSADGGMSWTRAVNGIPAGRQMRCLLRMDESGEGDYALYAGADRGLLRSSDGGTSWAAAGLETEDIFTLAWDGRTLWAGAGSGLWKR